MNVKVHGVTHDVTRLGSVREFLPSVRLHNNTFIDLSTSADIDVLYSTTVSIRHIGTLDLIFGVSSTLQALAL